MALVILGLGNDLIGDDGVGLLAAARLEGRLGPDVAVRTSAQSGLYLLEHLQGFDDAIVIDSVLGDAPGRVRELEARHLPPTTVPSAHYAGLPEVLAVARAAGMRMPTRLKVIAVEIAGAQTIGASPGPAVLAAIPEVVSRATQVARTWGYGEGEEASPDA
jgi:hydrogenase maturation protease